MKTLVINLGSTSTKAAVYERLTPVYEQTIRHCPEALSGGVVEQKKTREKAVRRWLTEMGCRSEDFAVIAARGGLLRPNPGGIYLVDEAAARDAASGRFGEHPCNVGLLIAREWSLRFGIPAIFADAPTTDELSDVARVTGVRGVSRRSVFHALNVKQAVRTHCAQNGLDPLKARLVVAHMGGGITVAAVDALQCVDVTNGLDGEGPFTPERAGALPVSEALRLAREAGGDGEAVLRKLRRESGLKSLCGSADVAALARRALHEPEVALALDAMLYNVAKHVGAMAAALGGQPDAILLTGGIAHDRGLMDKLVSCLSWLAPCRVLPGEDELLALATAAYRFLTGEEEARPYGMPDTALAGEEAVSHGA